MNLLKDKLAYYSRHNFLLTGRIREIEAASRLRPDELRSLHQQQVMQVIRHAAAKTAFYRERYAGIDLQGPFSEVYPALPVLQKSDLRENGKRLLAAPAAILKKAHTSGTSGSPLEVYRSPGAILRERAYVWFFRMQHGVQMGDRLVSMRGVLDNSTLHYFNKAENTLYLSSYLLSKKNIHHYAEQLNRFRPKAIFAFPSSLFALVNLLNEAGLSAEVPLIFTSSETLYPFQRERIEKGLNGNIFDWYGNAERSIALGQCEKGAYHELPLYGINEFLTNGVVTTSLINRAFPLIKYYVDDRFTLMNDDCSCGRGRAVRSVEGRVDDVVKLPDGTQVGRLGVAFQGIPNLRYAQIVQEEISSIRVNIVTGPRFNAEDQQLLLHKLRRRLNNSLGITFHKIGEEEIVKSSSGKYKLIVSKIPAS